MEIAEYGENNATNPVTPPPSTHYIVYKICICVHISAGTGFKKEVYVQSLERI